MRLIKQIYALICATWLTYLAVAFLRVPVAERNPHWSGFVYCMLLLGVAPCALGYGLLLLVPRILRRT
jgi:hypothetical protein